MKKEQHEVSNVQSPAGAMMALIERAATSSDVDVEKLEKLLDMKERWERGEAKKSFDRAMTHFRSEVGSIRKTRKAHNSSYAGLHETIRDIKPLLTDCGLSYSWRTSQDSNAVSVTCVVSHVDGHSEQTTLTASPDTSGSKNSIQAIGSTVTYLERYTLYAILGLASTDQDDDGAAAGAMAEDELIDASTQADIEALVDDVLKTPEQRVAFTGWLKTTIGAANGFIRNIPASKAEEVVAQLNRKRSAK